MTRSAEFSHTVKHGVRAAQPFVVVHACHRSDGGDPQIGFVVSKTVGGAVDRHRVSRRLRHVVRGLLTELDAGDRIVVRALVGSRTAGSDELRRQVESAVRRGHRLTEPVR